MSNTSDATTRHEAGTRPGDGAFPESGAALAGQGAHAGDRTQPQPGARPVKAPLLEIRGLHKRYGETVALHNIDLTLHRGEVVVILGPSGCGKSTLLRCINGLEPIQGGEIRMAGVGVFGRDLGWDAVRQKVGMVFQSYELFAHMDEITAALDPEMVREVLDVVLELACEGMSMIIVTHEMGFAEKVADRIVFMDGGRIVEEAPPAEFFAAQRTERARVFLNGMDYVI